MIGNGMNYKSMSYVGNIVAFIKYLTDNINPGYQVYNYADQPDINMKELVNLVENCLGKKILHITIPYFIGILGGYFFDLLGFVLNRKYPISSVRVKKFCATTQFDATEAHSCGFKAPFTLAQGLHNTLHYEFIEKQKDGITFESE